MQLVGGKIQTDENIKFYLASSDKIQLYTKKWQKWYLQVWKHVHKLSFYPQN